MKPLIALLLPALVLLGQQTQTHSQSNQTQPPLETKSDDLCTIEGQVTNSATGAPLRKAELSLRGAERTTPGTMAGGYSATSDAGGNFTIKDIQPGKYTLSAQRTGFVSLQYGARGPLRPGTTLTLNPGQRLKDLSLRLIPQAVITGRIVDENNEPIASAWVQTLRYSYVMGKRQLMQAGGANTNDLGEYRIFGLAPGRYYLVAKESNDDWEANVDASVSPATENYVSTYYPGTRDPGAAMPIDIGPGEMRDLNLALVKSRTFYVYGRVQGRPDAEVVLLPRGQAAWMSIDQRNHGTGPNGAFEFHGILPGAYTLTASNWSNRRNLSARQELDVGDSDIGNIVLVLSSGSEISGRVVMDSEDTAPDLGSSSVLLQPRDIPRAGFGSMASDLHDGEFTLSDVAPETYYLDIRGLPDGYWVKSIQMGDQEVRDTGLDLTNGTAGTITIKIAPNAGQIDGLVINNEQQQAGATVVLVPEEKLRDNRNAYKRVVTDQSGRFSLKNIVPGDYKLFAWEDIEYGAYMDPDFLRPVENLGHAISIQEGSHEAVQLKVIPADSAPAARKEP
jgi:hypothetical protein